MATRLLVVAIGLSSATARADAALDEYGAGVERRAAMEITEASCELDLAVTGGIATGELRQRFRNPGAEPLAAIATIDLPAGAVVTGFAVGGDLAIRVNATSRTEVADATDVLDADPATLVALGHDTYRATLQPIAPGHELAIATRFAVRPTVRDGALTLAIPGREHGGGLLSTCRATARATPGPGATIDRIHVEHQEGGSRGPFAFALESQPLVLEIELAFARDTPVAWLQSADLGEGWRATLATVIAPPVRATAGGARRVVFVVDGSRSMELVGRANVAKVVHAIAATLPPTAEVEAVLFDRTAARATGAWTANSAGTAALERAIVARPSANGTDLAAAFRVVRDALAGSTSPATVVVITDAMLPALGDRELVDALGTATRTDVHVVAIEPARVHAASAATFARPIDQFGGSFAEVSIDDLDGALANADAWLRPSWVGVALGAGANRFALPPQLATGAGASALVATRGAVSAPTLAARAGTIGSVPTAAITGPNAGVAQLALAEVGFGDARLRERLGRAHPFASTDHMFAVLATHGKVAASRRVMVAGGGTYTRSVALPDPPEDATTATAPAAVAPTASAIAEIALTRLFREQLQPRAFACYQRALGLAPALGGTVAFSFHFARGEVTRATTTPLGDPAFDACVLDAAYSLAPPIPDFSINADDETIANYPLVFQLADHAPTVHHSGEADSDDPLDIDAIEGGVPDGPRKPVTVDTRTPLGRLRPH